MSCTKHKNIYKNIVLILFLVVLSIVCNYKKIINIPTDDKLISMQFNLLTVSTVFAGFSFTVLGLIISLSDTSILITLKETTFLRAYCSTVINSIIFFIFSVSISLYFILGINLWIETITKKDTVLFTTNIPYVLGLLFLLYGIALFCKSVCKLTQTLNKNFEINEKKGQEKVKKFQDAMNKAE